MIGGIILIIKNISILKLFHKQIESIIAILATLISLYLSIKSDNATCSALIGIFYAFFIFIVDYVNGFIIEHLNSNFSEYYHLYIETEDVIKTLKLFNKNKSYLNQVTLISIIEADHRISSNEFGTKYIHFNKTLRKYEKILLNYYFNTYNIAINKAEQEAEKYLIEHLNKPLEIHNYNRIDILQEPVKWLIQNYDYDFGEQFLSYYKKHMIDLNKSNIKIISKKNRLSKFIIINYIFYIFYLKLVKRKINSTFESKINDQYEEEYIKNKIFTELNSIDNKLYNIQESIEYIQSIVEDKNGLDESIQALNREIKEIKNYFNDY